MSLNVNENDIVAVFPENFTLKDVVLMKLKNIWNLPANKIYLCTELGLKEGISILVCKDKVNTYLDKYVEQKDLPKNLVFRNLISITEHPVWYNGELCEHILTNNLCFIRFCRCVSEKWLRKAAELLDLDELLKIMKKNEIKEDLQNLIIDLSLDYNGENIKYLLSDNKTEERCIMAVKSQNVFLEYHPLRYIENITEKIAKAAIKNLPMSYTILPQELRRNRNIILTTLYADANMIQYVEQSHEYCDIAVTNKPFSLEYCTQLSSEKICEIVSENPEVLETIPDKQTFEVCLASCESYPENYRSIVESNIFESVLRALLQKNKIDAKTAEEYKNIYYTDLIPEILQLENKDEKKDVKEFTKNMNLCFSEFKKIRLIRLQIKILKIIFSYVSKNINIYKTSNFFRTCLSKLEENKKYFDTETYDKFRNSLNKKIKQMNKYDNNKLKRMLNFDEDHDDTEDEELTDVE